MSEYKTVPGDTPESISRKTYGTEANAGLISKANPGGISDTAAVPKKSAGATTEPGADDNVTININGTRFRFWDSVEITRSIDIISTVEFGAPFDPDMQTFRDIFRPFSFQDVEVNVGDGLLFNGTMLTPLPTVDGSKTAVNVACYSKPGALNDCTAPASAYPIEFNNQNLRDIASTLAEPFGVDVVFIDEPGPVFKRVACDVTERVLQFLVDLARQRNLVVSDNSDGALVFWRSAATGSPVAKLIQGFSPLISVSPSFNPQDYYSSITGIEPIIIGSEGSQYTVKNSKLAGVVRPFTFKAVDTEPGGINAAVEAKAGRMFGNMVSYTATVATWRDSSGKLWAPNTSVILQAPGAMVYSEYEFIIRSVRLNATHESRIATLDLVLPGSFDGVVPTSFPWD